MMLREAMSFLGHIDYLQVYNYRIANLNILYLNNTKIIKQALNLIERY